MSGAGVLLFGGTSEGRRLTDFLLENHIPVTLCVATGYGKEQVMENRPGLTVAARRLDAAEMAALIREREPAVVVDATHPYAGAVTANIQEACDRTGAACLRVLRPAGLGGGAETVPDMAGAARYLAETGMRALLTVGSKELEAFTAVPDYQHKLFARVLPDPEVVAKCKALGFPSRNLICMQGPFSRAMNVAIIQSLGVDCLVTKDSGDAGGFGEKLAAAQETGIQLLVVGRPAETQGVPLEAALEELARHFGLPAPVAEGLGFPRFPLFVSLEGQRVLVVGGGTIGTRRVQTLLEYGALVHVVAPTVGEELLQLAGGDRVIWRPGAYRPGDLADCRLAVACTDSREVNGQVGLDATHRGIPVSVADRREEGTFWFPATIRERGCSVGLTSDRGDHRGVRAVSHIIREGMRKHGEDRADRKPGE